MQAFGPNNNFAPRPTNSLPYDSREFWETFHSFNEHYEWFGDVNEFDAFLKERFSTDLFILIPGIGTSNILDRLTEYGYRNLTYSDYCACLVERLKIQYPDTPCYHDDIRFTNITYNCYDLIIDKGLLDCYLRGSNPAQPDIARQILANYHQILTREGTLLYIGSLQIEELNRLLDKQKWSMTYMHPLYIKSLSTDGRSHPSDRSRHHLYCLRKLNH